MVTPTRKFDSVFYPSLSLFNEDHNKEYPLKKYEYFPNCGFQSTFKNTWNDNNKPVSIEERQQQASEQ